MIKYIILIRLFYKKSCFLSLKKQFEIFYISTMYSPFRIVIFFIALALCCLFCIPQLNINLLPQDQSQVLTVSYGIGSGSPDQIEQQATSIFENTFSNLKNLKKITSYSGYNSGRIQLFFDRNEDIAYKKLEVAALIRQVRDQLSNNISYPVITQQSDPKKKSVQSPLLVYTLNGFGTNYEIQQIADALLRRKISMLKGIQSIDISGTQGQQININYNLDKLKSYRLQVSDIIAAFNEYNEPFYPGIYKDRRNQLSFIKVNTSTSKNLEDIQRIVVTNTDRQSLVTLKDIASVHIEDQEQFAYFRINGKNAVSISVYAQSDINSLYLAKEVKNIISKLLPQLPKGYEIRMSYDDTEFLRTEINKNYQRAIIALTILLSFVFLSYKNFRHILNIFLSLIVNLCLTILLAWLFEINIHIYTLAGIAISFGIMIDHAIIMVDYYRQYKNRKVFLALLGATLTTISALLLVFFLPEDQKKYLSDFAMIIVLALFSSLVTNLWFTVGMHNLLFDKNELQIETIHFYKKQKKLIWQNRYKKLIDFISKFRKPFLICIIILFGIPFFILPERIERWETYNNTIGSEYYQKKIAPILDQWLGGTLRLFNKNIYDNSQFRELGKPKLFIDAELPIGNTTEQMNNIIVKVENYIKQFKGIEQYITNVKSGQFATIEINFLDGMEHTNFPDQLKSYLTNKILDWGGVSWNIFGVGQGFSNATSGETPTFKIKMTGYNYYELEQQAHLFRDRLAKNKRAQKINIDENFSFDEKKGQEYVLQINQKLAFGGGISPQEAYNALAPITKSIIPSAYFTMHDKIYPVMIKSINAEEFSRWDLLNTNIDIDKKRIQLKDISTLSLNKTAGGIHKENRQYIRIIGFEYFGTYEMGNSFLEETLTELKQSLPIGYTATKNNYGFREIKGNEHYYLILALLFINYIICSVLFENLKQPLYIIATVPISFIGLFLIFYLFDFPFDQGGYAAFIMLGGLVVNAGIFIVNDFNMLLKQRIQTHYNKLLIKAILNRGRTIMLTTIAAICGLIPFLVDGPGEPFWFSLAIGTIGGLIFSLFAIFVVLPVLLWEKRS